MGNKNNKERMGLKYYFTFKYHEVIQKGKLDKKLFKKFSITDVTEDTDFEIIQQGEACEILNFPIEIDELMSLLTDLKNKGCTHISISEADDKDSLYGYRFQGVEIKTSEEFEIKEFWESINKKFK